MTSTETALLIVTVVIVIGLFIKFGGVEKVRKAIGKPTKTHPTK
jgi:hypothetical protein